MALRTVVAPVAALCLLLSGSHLHADEHDPKPSWIFAGGEVVDVGAKSFTVETLEGKLHVHLKSWNWFLRDRRELDGKQVHVVGQVRIQDGNKAILTPMGITLNEWNTHHHVAGFDQASMVHASRPQNETQLLLCGTVTKADGGMIAINTGNRNIRVNTRGIVEDIVDDEGYQKVDVGSRVLVSARLERSFFEEGAVDAERVITLLANLEE
ncbi:MAG: hypothetical protein R3242_06145 [Akkermansiaceae bacterium]|nr:hypothetical protein [Akkermansiaceae bacterium]